jgi:hypothetical protein
MDKFNLFHSVTQAKFPSDFWRYTHGERMKTGITLLALLFSITAYAGGYYNPTIDTYDPVTGLYFKSIDSEEGSGFLSSKGKSIVNLYIYDPATGTGKLLFPKSDNFQIVALSFETSVEDGEVKFHSDYSAPIKNNQNIEPRNPKSNMLILTRNTETKDETFYFANKNGSDLQKVKTISQSEDWHVDVKNSVIRVIKQIGSELKIESFKW